MNYFDREDFDMGGLITGDISLSSMKIEILRP